MARCRAQLAIAARLAPKESGYADGGIGLPRFDRRHDSRAGTLLTSKCLEPELSGPRAGQLLLRMSYGQRPGGLEVGAVRGEGVVGYEDGGASQRPENDCREYGSCESFCHARHSRIRRL